MSASCFQTDSHGNVISVANGTITLAGHPPVVALASFVIVAIAWVTILAMVVWSFVKLPPRENSHDLRLAKWGRLAILWYLGYLTADATLRFLQYHGFTFPIEFTYTELARVKPQGLAEYFCFVAILRCKDVFIIGNFDHLQRWKYVHLFFLFLLTVVDLIGSAADYYHRYAQVQQVNKFPTNGSSMDDCLEYSVYAQLKTYADIVFYAFSLVCCVFFTFIIAKFKIKVHNSTIRTYRFYYTIVVAAFWAHSIQCLAGSLIFDQFNIMSTQTTELIYIAIYDVTMVVLLFFLVRLKKLEIDPQRCNYDDPRPFTYTEDGHGDLHYNTSPSAGYAGQPSMTSSSTDYVNRFSGKFPTSTTSYVPVYQFD